MTVFRTGGGLGSATVDYYILHLTTDESDVATIAPTTASSTLTFDEGVVQLTFKVGLVLNIRLLF